ncbi:hypothetical protein FEM03_10565 [Phragmitibacter flavus]|uniref:Uncharacterized protein n=2 Tax=Phragmitibacter flavus TaxID=2576071 RepID=A0A5R8KF54_9BACT|nr:hypothetical protein FEM03_10565 [Phragmitibacter flavus]
MAKTLCDWKKHEIVDDIDELLLLVRDPRYVCRKCARVAHSDKHLCKAMALPKLKDLELEMLMPAGR